MNKLKNALSDMFYLLVPNKNDEIYSWTGLILGIASISFAYSGNFVIA